MSPALPGNNKTFDDIITMTFYDVILYFILLSGKKAENPNFFVFYLICLKFGIGANFEMLITKSKCKLTLENDWSKNCNFLPILAKILPSTLQQWCYHGKSGCPMGLLCIQNLTLLVYSKSHKVWASYSLLFQHQPVVGFCPSGLFKVKQVFWIEWWLSASYIKW